MRTLGKLIDRRPIAASALTLLAVCVVCALGALFASSEDLRYAPYIALLIGVPAAILTAFVLAAYWLRRRTALRASIFGLIALVFAAALVWYIATMFFAVLYMDSQFGSFGRTVEVRRERLLLNTLIGFPVSPSNVFPQLEAWSRSEFSVYASMFVFAVLLFGLGLLAFVLSRFQAKGLAVCLIIGLLPVALVTALTLDPRNFELAKLVPKAYGIPQYPGSKITTIEDLYSGNWHKVTFETDATPEEVLAFYNAEMSKIGWTLDGMESGNTRLVFLSPYYREAVSLNNRRLTVDASYRWFSLEIQDMPNVR